MSEPRTVTVLAGPNGAGKTTNARVLLPDLMEGGTFVNADIIEQQLASPGGATQAFAAGRVMLDRMRGLVERRESFAFETTLASRTFAPLLRDLKAEGYRIYLLYFWLDHPDTAIARVANRVELGGHHVPPDVVRRRYQRGLINFFTLYRPLADTWRVYDNSGGSPVLVAYRLDEAEDVVLLTETWKAMQREAERR